MTANRTIIEQVKDRQQLVFRLASDPVRYGMTKKAISADSQIGYDSICDYANGLTEMPLSAFVRLIGVLPNELLSLLLPEGQAIVAVPDDVDHDRIAEWVADYAATKNACHHPESEAGRDIGPTERSHLDSKVAFLPLKGMVA